MRESDILLHVVDASSTVIDDYITVVEDTLEDLDIKDKKMLMVFNKVDKVQPEQISELKAAYPDAVFISAERGIGLDKLEDRIQELIEEDFVTKTMKIPVSKYEGVAFIHRVANIHSEQYVNSSVKLKFSIAKEDLMRLKNMLNNIDSPESVV